jgi:hypothetical protein
MANPTKDFIYTLSIQKNGVYIGYHVGDTSGQTEWRAVLIVAGSSCTKGKTLHRAAQNFGAEIQKREGRGHVRRKLENNVRK